LGETKHPYGNLCQRETCERRDEDLAGRASFQSSRRHLDSRRRDNMMNRLRTALVSVTAVAVAMMVLGSNARAQSVSTASPQDYLTFLQGLPEMKNGEPWTQGLGSLGNEAAKGEFLMQEGQFLMQLLSILEMIPQTATLYNQELRVFSMIQNNINALLAIEAKLPPQAFETELNSIQALVVKERGVATPVR